MRVPGLSNLHEFGLQVLQAILLRWGELGKVVQLSDLSLYTCVTVWAEEVGCKLNMLTQLWLRPSKVSRDHTTTCTLRKQISDFVKVSRDDIPLVSFFV